MQVYRLWIIDRDLEPKPSRHRVFGLATHFTVNTEADDSNTSPSLAFPRFTLGGRHSDVKFNIFLQGTDNIVWVHLANAPCLPQLFLCITYSRGNAEQ